MSGPILNIEDILDSYTINSPRLNKDATHVVYVILPVVKSDKDFRETCALWIVDTSIENSARAITSGQFNDHSPVFHPVTSDIFFLSDRHKAGTSHIYKLTTQAFAGEAVAITDVKNQKEVSSFRISPNGKFVAFVSADEEPEDKDKDKKSDTEIWGDKKDNGRLRVLELGSTEKPRILVSVDEHVSYFIWSPDSSQIFYRLHALPNLESNFISSSEYIISLAPESTPLKCNFGHEVNENLETVWTHRGDIISTQRFDNTHFSTSKCLYHASTADIAGGGSRLAYGETDDVVSLRDVGADSLFAVEVAKDLDTLIDVGNIFSRFTAFRTNEDAIYFEQWDLTAHNDQLYCVAVKSSAVRGEPPEVWFGKTKLGALGFFDRKLSSHHDSVLGKKFATTKGFYWKGSDGQDLQGTVHYPAGEDPVKLPTIINPHGGPYARDQYDMFWGPTRWKFLLAPRGYLVICPNYRGGLGRGNTFAASAHNGMGTLDWDDCQTMLDAVIERGMADPERLGMGGWSQGGFLTAWGCSRPNNPFKAGVMGAGVSDWATMVLTSDMTSSEADLGNGLPWLAESTASFKGCAIHDAANVTAAMLIIHGKNDERVPVSQATGMAYGIVRSSSCIVPPKVLLYPREGHGFKERLHVEDVNRQMLAHFDKHLK